MDKLETIIYYFGEAEKIVEQTKSLRQIFHYESVNVKEMLECIDFMLDRANFIMKDMSKNLLPEIGRA